jgi:hypothetical protein
MFFMIKDAAMGNYRRKKTATSKYQGVIMAIASRVRTIVQPTPRVKCGSLMG